MARCGILDPQGRPSTDSTGIRTIETVLGIPLPICGEAGGWGATELFGVTDSDQLIPDDDEATDPDGLGLILRICLVLFLGLIVWQAVLVPWTP
jgi:hypothetical protein